MINCLLTCLIKFELVILMMMQKIYSGAKFIRESYVNYPKDVLNIYAENEPAMESNEVVLSDLPSQLYKIETNDKIPDNC